MTPSAQLQDQIATQAVRPLTPESILRGAGFRETRVQHLAGPAFALVGIK